MHLQSLYEFLDKQALFIVLLVVLAIWIGIFLYLFRLDRRIRKLEENQ